MQNSLNYCCSDFKEAQLDGFIMEIDTEKRFAITSVLRDGLDYVIINNCPFCGRILFVNNEFSIILKEGWELK